MRSVSLAAIEDHQISELQLCWNGRGTLGMFPRSDGLPKGTVKPKKAKRLYGLHRTFFVVLGIMSLSPIPLFWMIKMVAFLLLFKEGLFGVH